MYYRCRRTVVDIELFIFHPRSIAHIFNVYVGVYMHALCLYVWEYTLIMAVHHNNNNSGRDDVGWMAGNGSK